MNITFIIITVILSAISLKQREWFDRFKLSPYRMVYLKEWYRIITHGFIHADYMHLAVNMLVLYSFGAAVESMFADLHQGQTWIGYLHYAAIYLIGMMVASLTTVRKYKDMYTYAAVGASGAVSAVLFAFIFFEPWHKIYLMGVIPIPGIVFGPLYLWYSSYMGRRGGGNVNHDAHFYGAVFGFCYPLATHPYMLHHFISSLLMQ
jgi:membrane associated rhomboid family serine protease